jgi:AcrR family transcriptional regulator
MGLRAMKVARTREQIVGIALDLFVEQGYEQTTIEQIAERAEIGSTTLYRYFPGKDALILEPFSQTFQFARLLRERPADEPLPESLGHVLHEALALPSLEDRRMTELRKIIDVTPGPRAKLWDLVLSSTAELEVAIAERAGRPRTDVVVRMSARLLFNAWTIAGERWWTGEITASRDAIVDEVLAELRQEPLILPISPR